MHHIFDSIAQAVKFAHIITAFPGDSTHAMGTLVQVALREAGIDTSLGDFRKPELLGELVADAKRLIMLEGQMERIECCALTATYSRDWPARRHAVKKLSDLYYAPRLITMLANRNMVATLVARHYIAERERGASWELAAISDQFKASKERTRAAAKEIDIGARMIEQLALSNLRRIAGYGPDRAALEQAA